MHDDAAVIAFFVIIGSIIFLVIALYNSSENTGPSNAPNISNEEKMKRKKRELKKMQEMLDMKEKELAIKKRFREIQQEEFNQKNS